MLPKTQRRIATVLTAIPVAFLVFDSVIKLVKIDAVTESMAELGWPDRLARPLGLLELLCLVAYLVPRTRRLGALALTGFLGGAVATHARLGDPLLTHTLFPIWGVAIFLWAGLALRDPITLAFVTGRR
jgi:hypothetical protein